jgi:Fic family protein
MEEKKPDRKADVEAVIDRGEQIALMEPLIVTADSRFAIELSDLAIELASRSAGFHRSLPEGICQSLTGLVRSMNCYYSNLIEGHHTHPIDIERALQKDYSTDKQKRNLQLEASAHVNVQAWIDEGGIVGRAATVEAIRDIHRRFTEQLPEELLWTRDLENEESARVIPGAFRERDVKVGRHIPISPGALPRFLQRFEYFYSGLGKSQAILSMAAAHHRLLWIHPFVDGNGRVARLLSHAILLETLDTGGIWSVARGLARNVERYKELLANCDLPRRNSLDGRGHLSQESLVEFTHFFLKTCLDQIDFMESLVQPDRLLYRILSWAKEEVAMGTLLPRSELVLEAVLYRGVLSRGDIPGLIGVGERQARRVVSALIKQEVLFAASSRAPLSLVFPARLASRWMPGLFPEK